MSRAENKAERLLKMEALLLSHPEGLTQSEIARHLGVDRSVIHRNLYDFSKLYPVVEHEDGRVSLDRSSYLVRVAFTLHEAMGVHLASRLLATRMDKHNPHAASALRKLGIALEKLAPRISTHVKQSADVMDEADQRQDPRYLEVLEKLTLAWAELKKVKVWHRSDKTNRVFEYVISPYFIEPYAVGQTTHVIGMDDSTGKMRTLKIERIERAEILQKEGYQIPAEFDPRHLLGDAWGIWYTDNEPVEVVLKFHRNVAGRLRETRWHRSEEETELQDGSILWKARVAEPQEMIPWIRAWGADCEVLEPRELRASLTREAQELAELYQVVEAQARKMIYYAHSRKDKDKSEWQPLIEHLTKTAKLAEKFGMDANISELAWTAGLMHDLGKYSKAFQARLDGSKKKVDHATAGARTAIDLFNKTDMEKWLATMLAYCIAGHHTGLPDYGSEIDVDGDGTLLSRLDPDKKKLEDFSAYKTEINPATLAVKSRAIKTAKEYQGFSLAFMIRILFSALVDADFQETESYMKDDVTLRGEYASIEELCKKFNDALRKFDNPQGDINEKRTETLKACKDKANLDQGFFTLTIPTGGGKTLASMAFALNHAVKHGLQRVIYVIPFTSIIEQNAAVFKEHLGEENVLEHHSNFDWSQRRDNEQPDDETKDALDKLKLASENWDIPVVVTTNVQFFESLFANKSSRCRKLHNLAKSVLIFDEAQMLPREYMKPCMLGVKEMVQNYGASAVFCTATQPSLERFLDNVKFTELAPNPQMLFDFYKRVQVKNIGKTPDAELIEKIQKHPQVLCIVNTRKHAKGLFDQLEDNGRFHLSTLMCPVHRKATLLEVRDLLKSDQPCRVISTQVMEAGIDVDFPVGFRALAGLDSIIQAAGRVNREMKQGISDVYVFDPETPFIKRTPVFIKQGAAVAESVLREHASQPDSQAAIEAYFKSLYNIQGRDAFDVKRILTHFDKGTGELDFDFKTVAEEFRLIDNNTVAVVIPYKEEAKKLLERAKYHPYPYAFARQLQMYTVNIYEKEFERLQSKGVIETINDTYEVLANMDYYNEQTGLVLPVDAGGDALFFDG